MYAMACDAPELLGVRDAHYFLLELDTTAKKIKITGYKPTQLKEASEQYLSAERHAIAGVGRDAVLVSVDSFKALKRAYPNYFLDTHRFIEEVYHAIQ